MNVIIVIMSGIKGIDCYKYDRILDWRIYYYNRDHIWDLIVMISGIKGINSYDYDHILE